ncbi:hypothetical protein CVT24_013252 [Panaeolus cyanescens]|uniref:Uncharacterized protein n=1 Tax=Panaeolus cyanescens TaxID=181874 RepID=A0A409YN34_9AGAR|nr:hypothetical protein CVT24_013252 [Panaeolus cyanescens]
MRPLSVKLLFCDAQKRSHLGVYHEAIIPHAVLESLMTCFEQVLRYCDPLWSKEAMWERPSVTGNAITSLFDDLEALDCPSPEHMPLQLIHYLHHFTLLDADFIPGERRVVYELLQRARALRDRFILIYQLRSVRGYGWVAPGSHCLLFDYRGENVIWDPDDERISEYELLYGRYRAPTREEVFWPYEDCCRFKGGW